jgi:hypothetical protein
LKNKDGGPRVPTCAKTKICRLTAPIGLARVSCFRKLRRQTPRDDSCPEIAGSGGIRSWAPVFFSNRLVFVLVSYSHQYLHVLKTSVHSQD